MTRRQLDGLLLFLTGCLLFVGIGGYMAHSSRVSMVDFGGAYYSARCLVAGHDPYRSQDLLHTYQAAEDRPNATPALVSVVALNEHLPAAYILTAPFALMNWTAAHIVFVALTGVTFVLAAFLIWSESIVRAPIISGALLCVFLLHCELILEIGNPAGISIGLCIIAVWCIIKQRFIPVGIACFAVSLAVTPHDAGLIWLYFLLAGGIYRKRALQTLLVTFVLSLPATLWVTHVAPNWPSELLTNLRSAEIHGAPSDPGPTSVDAQFPGALIIDLQSAVSLVRDDPHFYNPVVYMICTPLVLLWAWTALSKRTTEEGAWLGLAAIAPLSMLPLYHRTHDTVLLLIGFPALALLWSRGGKTKWIACGVTGMAAVVIGILPERLLAVYTINLRASAGGGIKLILDLIFTRPVPLILFTMSLFYLWVYARHSPSQDVFQVFENVGARSLEPVSEERVETASFSLASSEVYRGLTMSKKP